ncbi:PPOX class F420-dependent enzyme [Nocardioides sp. LS1]|nr:PPOX class F420-dependent enzyme [Nocardioides sp. LS1]
MAPVTSWTPDWDDFPPDLLAFWTERHLCTLTTVRPDGRPHVVPVGVALDHDERCAWVITGGSSRKAAHLASPGPVAACQVDRARWSTLEGTGVVVADPASVARAVAMYAARYKVPRENPSRVAIRIEVTRILSSRTV